MAPACPAETVRLEATAAPPFGAGGLGSCDRIRNRHFNSLLSFFFPFLGLFPFCYSLILEKVLCYSSCLCLRTSGPGFFALPQVGSITSGPAPAAGWPWRQQLGSRELLTGVGGSVGQNWCHLLIYSYNSYNLKFTILKYTKDHLFYTKSIKAQTILSKEKQMYSNPFHPSLPHIPWSDNWTHCFWSKHP